MLQARKELRSVFIRKEIFIRRQKLALDFRKHSVYIFADSSRQFLPITAYVLYLVELVDKRNVKIRFFEIIHFIGYRKIDNLFDGDFQLFVIGLLFAVYQSLHIRNRVSRHRGMIIVFLQHFKQSFVVVRLCRKRRNRDPVFEEKFVIRFHHFVGIIALPLNNGVLIIEERRARVRLRGNDIIPDGEINGNFRFRAVDGKGKFAAVNPRFRFFLRAEFNPDSLIFRRSRGFEFIFLPRLIQRDQGFGIPPRSELHVVVGAGGRLDIMLIKKLDSLPGKFRAVFVYKRAGGNVVGNIRFRRQNNLSAFIFVLCHRYFERSFAQGIRLPVFKDLHRPRSGPYLRVFVGRSVVLSASEQKRKRKGNGRGDR